MSSLMGSAIRHLERLLRKFESGVVKMRLSIPSAVEYVLVKAVYYGDRLLDLLAHFSRKLSRAINALQISMLDSMIVASLWYGFLTLALMLVVLLLYLSR